MPILVNCYLLKSLLLLTHLLSVFYPNSSLLVKCGSGRLSIYPTSESIDKEPLFLLQGSGEARSIIFNINEDYPIYLKSGNQKVRLIAKESYSGSHNISQILLKPVSPLTVGATYTLHIDNLPSKIKFGNYSSRLDYYEPNQYHVENKKDKTPPKFIEKPKKISQRFSFLGCGHEKYVIFSYAAKDISRTIVKTTVKNLKNQSTRTYYLLPIGNQIRVGKTMCEGEFDLEDAIDYEVKFSPIDICGNSNEWRGQGIIFSISTKEGLQNE